MPGPPPDRPVWPGSRVTLRTGVLALQGDVREHLAALHRLEVPAVAVRLPAELERVDALVIPGGESTTMLRLLRVFDLLQPLRHRLQEGMPTLSTCAGAILLSREVLDGRDDQAGLGLLDLRTRRNGYGRQIDSFEADLTVPQLPGDPFPAVFIRAPVFEEVGPRAEVLASHHARPVLIAQGPHLAMSFHPEMTGDDRLHRLFLDRVSTGETAAA